MIKRSSQLRSLLSTLLGLLLAVAGARFAGAAEAGKGKVDFNRDIRPILSENCFKCHGPDEGARKSKLRFDVRSEPLRPAKSGEIAIVPGSPEKSEMIKRVAAPDPDDRMPPLKTGRKLKDTQIDLLKKWIAQGAPYATHWAYVKPVRPPLPIVADKRWAKNQIDQFVLARLEREKLKPSPAADRFTLIRRASLDLTGLPPTIEEIDQFVNDRGPRAYEELVDRLLGKKAFGEHWARLWLDLARYADSAGYADDPSRTIWAYRDYVVRAFNANKPFDRFTIEQIAGDLLDKPDDDDLIATGFHRNTMTNNEGGTNDEEFRNAAVVDRVNTTMSVWMATSMGCAQCHTHKYDPISQQEYFRMFAFFNSTEDADRKDEAPVFEFYSEQQKKERAKIQSQIAALEKVFGTSTAESMAQQAEWEKQFTRNAQWTTFKPAEVKAEGATATVAEDGILRLSSKEKKAAYTLNIPLAVARVAGLKIESLPGEAPQSEEKGEAFAVSHILATIHPPEGGRPTARYVRVELPGAQRILSLAEVQVMSGETNVALAGAASQSSTSYEGFARLAIDGNTNGNYEVAKSTTHTEISDNPWWEVDLKSGRTIDRIVIWSRTGDELHKRLANHRVLLLDEKRQSVWERTIPEAPNPSEELLMNGPSVIQFAAAFVDQPAAGFDPKTLIQDKSKKGAAWVMDGDKAHWLTLLPAKLFQVSPGSRLELRIEQEQKKSAVARFRVMVSDREKLSDYAGIPGSVLDIFALEESARTPEQKAALTHYYRSHVAPELKSEQKQFTELTNNLAGLKPETVPVMRDLAADKHRKTQLQLRGNYLALADEVSEGVPAAFHPLPQGAPMNRLTLARWLVDENNPLTARVVANRFWEQIFGTGIVRTSEDFGTQGELPTHPELLDWLATELVAQKWDMKAFLKILVTSATYCQSSRVTPELQERDADNLLLARGPRFRMPAEVVRDQALAVSGLLSSKMYGPPVRPPQPSSGLTAAFGSSLDWQTSEGEDRYRRALYTEWRRTSPYPSMSTFDAPNREVCALRRPRSNTPLQALVTLNDPVYFEAAQALGRRMHSASGSMNDKVTFGFRLCLARSPRPHELKRLVDFVESARTAYEKKAAEPKTNNAAGSAKKMSPPELGEWSALGNVLLNLDETLMRP